MWLVVTVWVVVAILTCGPSAVLAQPCRPAYWNTRNGVVHTACQPRNRNCTILVRGLSNHEKKDFLRRHNKLRSLVAMGRLRGYKPAANMYELVWDDELAEVAQALADQCGDMMHDRADARFTRRFRLTGQNLASERRSNDVRKIGSLGFVDTWFKEHRDYPPYQVKHFEPSFGRRPTGHFTQVIWADTRYLGCGFTMFRMKGDLSVMPYQKHYVCNYADRALDKNTEHCQAIAAPTTSRRIHASQEVGVSTLGARAPRRGPTSSSKSPLLGAGLRSPLPARWFPAFRAPRGPAGRPRADRLGHSSTRHTLQSVANSLTR
ncbi:venom allergen 5-like isoform X2 [Dermacentor andersoni]|uniref:venom allergen 5-like isoform X2 n=1 Tax=Dermacentor andersoni TaxID=34620 RepID=UPI003B3A3E66